MSRELFQHHPVFGYHFVPDLRARVQHESGGYLVRTNRAGFRSERQFERERSAGRFRILVFGDSFTAGDGVSNRARYTDVLETLVPDVEVYNFGLPGSGTDQQYLIWREIGRHFEHDLVILGIQVENIRRVVARYRVFESRSGEELLLPKPYFTRGSDGGLVLHGVPVPEEPVSPKALSARERRFVDHGGSLLWLRRMISRFGGRAKALAQRLSRQNPVPGYNRAHSGDWLLLKAILTTWISEIAAPVIIMPIPLYHFIEEISDPRRYQARFAELDAPPRVMVHDPLPDLLRYASHERRGFRFEKDVHPTPAGHRALAQSLARRVATLKNDYQEV